MREEPVHGKEQQMAGSEGVEKLEWATRSCAVKQRVSADVLPGKATLWRLEVSEGSAACIGRGKGKTASSSRLVVGAGRGQSWASRRASHQKSGSVPPGGRESG